MLKKTLVLTVTFIALLVGGFFDGHARAAPPTFNGWMFPAADATRSGTIGPRVDVSGAVRVDYYAEPAGEESEVSHIGFDNTPGDGEFAISFNTTTKPDGLYKLSAKATASTGETAVFSEVRWLIIDNVAGPDSGQFKWFSVLCDFSHTALDDPIVNPGGDAAHLHQFFGALDTNRFSTLSSMRAGGTSCDLGRDTAGYWVPTLEKNGVTRTANFMLAYYRNDPAVNLGGIVPIPADFRLIAGGASLPAGERAWFWNCSGEPDNTVRTAPPNCGALGKGYVRFHVAFPNCWDGVNTDSADHRSHMAWPISGSACPASHPVKIPRVLQNFHFQGLTNGTGWELSDHTIKPHADFWNTWDQEMMRLLTEGCLHQLNECPTVDDVARAL